MPAGKELLCERRDVDIIIEVTLRNPEAPSWDLSSRSPPFASQSWSWHFSVPQLESIAFLTAEDDAAFTALVSAAATAYDLLLAENEKALNRKKSVCMHGEFSNMMGVG